MRILSFEQNWTKLNSTLFTTFRFPRRDKDWHPGELVKVVVKARTAERQILGVAKISVMLTNRVFPANSSFFPASYLSITTQEAIADGFADTRAMYDHFNNTYGKRLREKPLNKLVLMYTERYEG